MTFKLRDNVLLLGYVYHMFVSHLLDICSLIGLKTKRVLWKRVSDFQSEL